MMVVNMKLLCLSSFILLLCLLEYSIVICKDAVSVFNKVNIEGGLEESETCYATDCSTTETMLAESKTGGLAHHFPDIFKLVYGSFSSAIKSVYQTAKYTGENVYSTVRDYTKEFAENVRRVLREEFDHLIINGFYNVIATATAPGTTLFSLGITALSIFLFLLCLFLNYIFLFFFSFISIITFDCIVIFLHYHLGPKLIFDYIVIFCSYFSRIIFFVSGYPYYISLGVTILLCISFSMPIIRMIWRRKHRIRIKTLSDNMVQLNLTISDIQTQLNNIESKIDTILSTMEETS